MNKLQALKELLAFLKTSKKWWLIPIILFLFILSFLTVFLSSSAIAPFIYTIF